ncbi:AbrB/MazE/SpoVT family DNA-binding domain-containing protein [Candidatus Woesearchaeota archaeon]|nr:AbrB/MazE/SpoVT family DNA-binding domain-containing protein [Candidatus Woesearchaeota archaeon]
MSNIKRKVVKHGPSTLIISLPSEWAKKNSISQGAELEVSEKGKELIVSPSGAVETPLEADIDVTPLDRSSILFYIRSFYRKGYHRLNVKFDNQTTTHYRSGKKAGVLSTIHKEVNNLIGIEVTQQGHNSCVIRDLSSATGAEFEGVLKRLFVLFLESLKDVADDIEKNDLSSLLTIEEKHDTITKFASYCLRILNRRKYKEEKEIPFLYHTILTIDVMIDIMKYFSRAVIEKNQKFGKESAELMHSLTELFDKTKDIYENFELEKVHDLQEKRTEWKNNLKKIMETSKEEAIHLNYLAPLIEHFRDLVETRMCFY